MYKRQSKDSLRAITVTPSVKGRATQFDKDLLIYVVSQMTEALKNLGVKLDKKSQEIFTEALDLWVEKELASARATQ